MKKIKILIGIAVIALVMIIAGYGFLFTGHTVNEDSEVKIGAILSLTGNSPLMGKTVQQGILTAVDEINEGNGKKIKVIFEDSKNDPKEGISAFHKLNGVDNVPIIITQLSSVTKALVPLADEKEVPLFATITATPKITEGSEWAFRDYYTTEIQGEVMSEFIVDKLKINKMAILYLNDAYGSSAADYFKESFEKREGKIVIMEKYEAGYADLRTQISKIKESDTDGVIVLASDKALGNGIKQVRELGVNLPTFTYTGLDASVLKEVGDAAEGVYVISITYDPENPITNVQKNFVNRYKVKYGELPGHYSAFGYAVIQIFYYWRSCVNFN